MEAEFDKLVAAGFLPAGDAEVNQAEESPAEPLVEEKAAPKKRTSRAKK